MNSNENAKQHRFNSFLFVGSDCLLMRLMTIKMGIFKINTSVFKQGALESSRVAKKQKSPGAALKIKSVKDRIQIDVKSS